jgi:prevent-host-death family protein
MKTISVTEFKAHCLELMNEAHRTGEPIEILKRGKPFMTVQPQLRADVSYEPGYFKDQIKIVGDITEPVVPLEEWDLEKRWF